MLIAPNYQTDNHLTIERCRRSLARGESGGALAPLFRRSVGVSLRAVVEQLKLIRRIVRGLSAVRAMA